MINVSFYLLTPTARSQSQLYVSISNKESRLRFASGESFVTAYCNIRKKKGSKELIKKNTPFYFEYNAKLNEIRDALLRIEMDLNKAEVKHDLIMIKEKFYASIGKSSKENGMSFDMALSKFVSATEGQWTEGTKRNFNTMTKHLKEFEKTYGEFTSENINEELWNGFRDKYFVAKKKFGNASTNKNLKKLKQFLRFALKKKYIVSSIDLDELKYLDEIEPFKIALQESEVETLFNLDLSNEPRLDKVRDLFALEILTGQRFSDTSKVLDSKHISDTNILIYQQKTGERVSIPLHPKLRFHLSYIFAKYPDGLPAITNQKFNDYLKEICILAKFTKEHSWIIQTGKKKIQKSDFRYNLVSSHTGRRTFCTLALKSGIASEIIMKVTGHKKYEQFRDYVKVDDSDLDFAFDKMFSKK